MRAELADELEAFVEEGSLWDPPALAAFVARLADVAQADSDPLVDRLGRFLEAVRLRQQVGEVTPPMRAEIEAVVYPRVWKVIEAVRAGMPDGELRTRLEVMNRRLARLFVEETRVLQQQQRDHREVNDRAVNDDVPSWVVAPATTETTPRAIEPVPARLRLLVVVTAAAVALEVAHVAGRSELVPGFRVGLVLVVAVQLPLAVFAARRSAASALGLFVYQATTVLAAVGGGFGDLRVVLAAAALVGGMLLGTSLHLFPTPELPPSRPPDPPDPPDRP